MDALDDDALRQTPYPKQAHNDVTLHRQPAAAGPHLIHHIHPLALHLRTAMPAVTCATVIVPTYIAALAVKIYLSCADRFMVMALLHSLAWEHT